MKSLKIINNTIILLIITGLILTTSTGTPTNQEKKPTLVRETIYVGGSGPNNYSTIQAAIDNATHGDTIYVYQGIYHEHIIVDKQLTLVGQNKNQTIINSW